MADKVIEYEIYAISAYGSDVLIKFTLEQALKCAKEWSMESVDTDIMIVKVEKTKEKVFRNGGEIE